MRVLKRLHAFSVLYWLLAVLCSALAVKYSEDSFQSRYSRSLGLSPSDENTCYNLGIHATCMGTLSSRKEDQKTLAQLLSSFKLPPNIQHLTISHNVVLSSASLHVLENLLELNISNNAVAAGTMDQNFLSHFPRLTTLKIVKSGLTTLPVFRDRHAGLVNLVMNQNDIQSWSEASLRALPNLKVLHLSGNNISELRTEMFPVDYPLEELAVSNNRISRIDSLVGTSRLKQLRVFRLGRNSLHVSLNQSASQSQKSRPDIFPHFPSVRFLDLSRNGLEFIPPLMFREWSNLRELRLKRNRLQFFGAGSFYIEKGGLSQLDLSYNRVASVNREVTYGLDELVGLVLAWNRIRTVQTDAFEKLKKLQHLNLEHNQLSFIGGIFDPLSSLETLQLSSNPNLAQLPSNGFGGLHRLKELDLSNNSIHVIDDKVFESLNQLRKLSLATNQITLIRGGYFSGLVRLEELDLRGNNITGVEESESNDLNGMIFLRKLHLHTVHYHCGLCSLRAFVSWLRSKSFTQPDVLVQCASPPELRGQSVLAFRDPQTANCEIGLVPKVIGHPPSEAKLVGHNLSLVCTILSNLQPVVAWQRAPLPPEAVAAKPTSGGVVSVISAGGDSSSGGGGSPLVGKPVYTDLTLRRDQVTLVRSDKEWRAQLRLANLNTSDSGLYRCSVTVNPAAASTAAPIRSLPATIRVLAPPRQDQRPERSYEAREGQSIEIPCSSSGFPKPEQSLRRLGSFPAAVERRLTLPGDSEPARFGIRDLTGADTGRYLCISENAAGRVETPFELEVLTAPRFQATDWPSRVAVRPGGDLTLDCSTSGNPAPQVAWYLGEFRLDNRTEGQLRLTSAVASDAGVYKCEAANSVGSASRRVLVVVGAAGGGLVDTDDDQALSTTSTTPRQTEDPTATTAAAAKPSFSLLVFAVVVSAMSCVLLTTLLWSVVFVFLRRKSRRMKRSLSQRLAEAQQQLCQSEPALLQQQQQQQIQQQQNQQQHRIPLMVASLMALPHAQSGADIAASHMPPPLPPFHLHQRSQQPLQPQQPHPQQQQRWSRCGSGNSAHRSEPDLMLGAGGGGCRFPPLLQHQRSHQPQKSAILLLQQQQQQKPPTTAAPPAQQPPPLPHETSDYNTGSASSGDSVEHLRLQQQQHQQGAYNPLGYYGHLPLQLPHLQTAGAWQQTANGGAGRLVMLSSGSSQHHLLHQQHQQQQSRQHPMPRQQQPQPPQLPQQHHLCTSFTGQRSPSSTDFDSGYEPSGSLARPRSSRSLFSVNGGAVIAVRETVT